MSERLAHLISYVFHPILMPSYAVMVLFSLGSYVNYSLSIEYLGIIAGLNFLNTAFMPSVFLLVLYKMNRISNLHLKEQYERTLPFLIAIFFYSFNYYVFKSSVLPQMIISMALVGALMVVFSFVLNFWVKISIHAIGISSLAGMFCAVSLLLKKDINLTLMLFFLLIGIVGTARLKLKAHEPHQVYLGSALGLILGFGSVYLRLG
jgi:hypothetical protein